MIDTRKITHWLLRDDEQFKGHTQSFLLPDGTVAYTDGLTPRQYAEDRGFPVRVVTNGEVDALMAQHIAAMITSPTEESEADYWRALEVLPPCRFQHCNGVELFHISERVQLNLVGWHASYNGRFFTMIDDASADPATLADAVRDAAAIAAGS